MTTQVDRQNPVSRRQRQRGERPVHVDVHRDAVEENEHGRVVRAGPFADDHASATREDDRSIVPWHLHRPPLCVAGVRMMKDR